MDLSELRPGIRVAGILASGPVEVVAVVPHGQDTVEVVFRSDDGNTGQRLIDRSYEARLEALDSDRELIGWRIEEAKTRLGRRDRTVSAGSWKAGWLRCPAVLR